MRGFLRRVRTALKGASQALPETVLTLNQRKCWHENGFLILKDLIPRELVAAINVEIESTVRNRRAFPNLKIDILSGALAGKRMPIAEAPEEVFSGSFELSNIYLDSAVVVRAALSDPLVAILSALLDGDPIVVNSLNLTRGSQQPSHCDTWSMPPKVPNKLAASFMCLEDLHPDAGPLFFYPGSHTVPPYQFSQGATLAIEIEMSSRRAYIESEVAARGLLKTAFVGTAGDVFLSHPQLLHGGLPIRNWALTRKSLVTRYWRRQDVPFRTVGRVDGRKYFSRWRYPA